MRPGDVNLTPGATSERVAGRFAGTPPAGNRIMGPTAARERRWRPPGSMTARPHTLRVHLRETLRLASPVMLARLGVLTIVSVDTAMSGHASGDDLAWYAIAVAPQVPLLLVGVGLLMGTVVMTAQAVGAGRPGGCGAIWRTALAHAIGVGVLMAVACAFGESFLLTAGQPADIAAGGGRVLAALGIGLPGMLLYVATSFFLEGIGRPIPGMVIMIGANVLNVGLNWLLVFGHGGFPALGAEGAAIATSIVRWCMFAAAALYVLRFVNRRRFGITAAGDPAESLGPRMRRIGLPAGLAHGMEARRVRGDDPDRRPARRCGSRRLLDPDEPALPRVHGRHRARDRGQRPGSGTRWAAGTGAACAGPDGPPPA